MSAIGALLKLSKGGLGVEAIGALMEALGMEASFSEVLPEADSFLPIGQAAIEPGAMLMQISGRLKDGTRFTGILAMNQNISLEAKNQVPPLFLK
jgi:hypothetical protein